MKPWVPSRIAPYFRPVQARRPRARRSEGDIVCRCGCDTFSILYAGRENRGGLSALENGAWGEALIVRATCARCGQEILLFDNAQDGWDGAVAALEKGYAKRPGPPAEAYLAYACGRKRCGKGHFHVRVRYEYSPEEEEVETLGADYAEGFGWIWMTLTCAACGKAAAALDEETS